MQLVKNIVIIVLALVWLLMLPNALTAQCTATETKAIVYIEPDFYALEISWVITDYFTDEVLASGNANSDTLCLPSNGCYFFKMFDAAGDGICCEAGDGFYQLYFDGELIKENGDYTNIDLAGPMGCAEGEACNTAQSVFLDEIYLANPNQNWYTITVPDSGMYSISTCIANNTCNSNITVYNYCNGLQYAENVQGALAFADSNCDAYAESAVLPINLFKDEVYYIKIDDLLGDCENNPIYWFIEYAGPLTGCTDPEACNYAPFATVSDNSLCTYPGDNPFCDGPDLVVDMSVFEESYLITKQEVVELDCYLQEGCVAALGERELLKFETKFYNIGNKDFYLGVPPTEPAQEHEFWEWASCHQHYHYEDYASYTLYDDEHNEIPIGFKTGFCMMDLECPFLGDYKYNCAFQGLTAGCADIYSNDLPCQWIDITDLSEGTYHFIIEVNHNYAADALGRLEQNYDNNWGHVSFELFRDAEGDAFIEIDENGEPNIDCEGNLFGTAQEDCAGTCEGDAIIGDINADGLFNQDDVDLYLADILINELTVTECNDISGDGELDIYDATIVQHCQNFGICPTLPHYSYAGPGVAISFINDSIPLTVNPYVDVVIRQPTPGYQLSALQFEVEGIDIESVEVLQNDESLVWLSGNQIAWINEIAPISFPNGMGEDGKKAVMRLYFSAIEGDEICLLDFNYAIDSESNLFLTQLDADNQCAIVHVPIIDTTANQPILLNDSFKVWLASRNTLMVDYQNLDNAQLIEIFDVSGRLLTQQKLPANKHQIEINIKNFTNPHCLIRISGDNWLAIRNFAALNIYNE